MWAPHATLLAYYIPAIILSNIYATGLYPIGSINSITLLCVAEANMHFIMEITELQSVPNIPSLHLKSFK